MKRGQSCATRVIPPEPKYWPIATSWKKIGIPQNVIAMKYTIRNAPEKKKETHRCNLQSKILESKNIITQIFIFQWCKIQKYVFINEAINRVETMCGSMTKLKNNLTLDISFCENQPVSKQYIIGKKLGVDGTPSFFSMDGEMLSTGSILGAFEDQIVII